MILNYWKTVITRAARETFGFIWGLQWGAALFAVLVAGTYLALIYFMQGEEEAKAGITDQLLTWIAPLLWFPVFYLCNFFRVPAILETENATQFAIALEGRDARIAAQQRLLMALGYDRCLHFDHANISRVGGGVVFELHYENTSDKMLSYTVNDVWVEHLGVRYEFPRPASSVAYAPARTRRYYLTGRSLGEMPPFVFPTQLTLNFDFHYDNVPPVQERISGRTVLYVISGDGPIPNAASLFLHEREESRGVGVST